MSGTQVWAVLSQKGGAGKSTIALHLAILAAAEGKTVLVIDIDPQRSAEKWSAHRQTDSPTILAGEPERLPEMIRTARSYGVHLVIVDTAPRLERAAVLAARAADLLIVPVRPTILDIPATQDTVQMAELGGPEMKARAVIVINGVINRTGLSKEAEEVFEKMGVVVCPHILIHRIDYQRALTNGKGVTEFAPRGKAAEEIRDVYRWICKYVGL